MASFTITEIMKLFSDSNIDVLLLKHEGIELELRKENILQQQEQIKELLETCNKRPVAVESMIIPTSQTASQTPAPPTPSMPTDTVPEPVNKPIDEPSIEGELITSPAVGTFYEAPAPGKPAFVKKGDRVKSGQVVCIIETMKVMNNIESDYNGVIVDVLVENGQSVEYGTPLFRIRTE